MSIKTYASKTVTKEAQRPAGKRGECFYCKQKIGQDHIGHCPYLSRWVKVKYEIELIEYWPEEWPVESIVLKIDQGSWCASNLAERIKQVASRSATDCACFCARAVSSVDATEKDLSDHGIDPIKDAHI